MADSPGSKSRSVSESQSEFMQVVLTQDVDELGVLHGGRLMQWIDTAAELAGRRHARTHVATASVEHVDFWIAVHVGGSVVLRSSVNRAFGTSMEVGVKIWVEDDGEDERRYLGSAYLTLVAIDEKGRPMAVPALTPESEEEKRRFEDAGRRRAARLKDRPRQAAAEPRSINHREQPHE